MSRRHVRERIHHRAVFFAALILAARALPSQGIEAPRAPAAAPRIEVVFVLDTTGSMGGLLQAAKEQIWSIATGLACSKPAADLRLGLVAFRDRNDAYVTKRTELTGDLDALYTQLIELSPDGGGDEPESVNQALHEAVTEIQWSTDPKAYRAIFLVGDAPPQDYGDDVDYQRSCELARERGVAVNAIQCGESSQTTAVWTEIARRGDGAYAKLDQNGGARAIETPYDKGISVMARQLDDTRLPYGSDSERAALEARQADARAIYEKSTLGAQATRGLYNVTETGRKNLYGTKDLVGDWQSGAVKLDEIDAVELPEPLRSMTPAERRAHLEQKAKLREDLELTLRSIAVERDKHIAAEEAKRGSSKESLTARLFEAMRSQAARHGLELGSCASASR